MDEPRRSKRSKAPSINDADNRAYDQLRRGYAAFAAPQLKFGDGEETTQVKLHYDLPNGSSNAIVGRSSNGHGHAELDALYQFWIDVCGRHLATFQGSTLALACLDKPCCVHCSSILGHLGVLAFPGTHKYTAPAGISYAIPPELRALLQAIVPATNDMVWQYFGSARLG